MAHTQLIALWKPPEGLSSHLMVEGEQACETSAIAQHCRLHLPRGFSWVFLREKERERERGAPVALTPELFICKGLQVGHL